MEVSRRKAVAFPKETFLTCWGPCGDRLFFPESERERGGGELERGRLLPYASSRHRMGNDTWLSTSSRSQILRVFTVYIYQKKIKGSPKRPKEIKILRFLNVTSHFSSLSLFSERLRRRRRRSAGCDSDRRFRPSDYTQIPRKPRAKVGKNKTHKEKTCSSALCNNLTLPSFTIGSLWKTLNL